MTHKAHTLNTTYKQHYAQVVDKFGDTWTRTKNGNGNWVWALGDYEENAPIYEATQTGTLPKSGEPYQMARDVSGAVKMVAEVNKKLAEARGNQAERFSSVVITGDGGFVERLRTLKSTSITDSMSDSIQDYMNGQIVDFEESKPAESDPINPDYYKFPSGGETIDITEHLTSNGGQAVQYIARSTRLDGRNKGDVVENLQKAIWFLNREINRLGGTNG